MAPEYHQKAQVIQSDNIAGGLHLRSSHMVIVDLVLPAPLCGIICWRILEIHRLLKMYSCS